MLRHLLSRTCLALLCLAALCLATRHSAASELICPRVPAAPILDGRLDDWQPLPGAAVSSEEAWQNAAAAFAEYGGPQDLSAEIRIAWDNSALYLALDIRDDALVRARSASDIGTRGDSVVISLADAGAADPNQFAIVLLRRASLVWRTQPSARAGEIRTINRAVLSSPLEAGTRLTYELALPWSELTPLRPLPGTEFTLTISVCDDDGAGLEGCLESPISVTLSAGGVTPIIPPVQPPPPAALPPTFSSPDVARFDRGCFTLHDRDVFLFAGEVDYARLPPAEWPARLALLKAAGLNTVSVVAPWPYHQLSSGRIDLARLRDFLDLCAQTGLWVQLDVGPYAGQSREAGGVPGWVLALASEQEERGAVQSWYRALLPLVAEYQLTAGGPVVALISRPLPNAGGAVDAQALHGALAVLQSASIEVPLLTANLPAARDNAQRPLANLLDTLSFYQPPAIPEMLQALQALAAAENGPPVISAVSLDCSSEQAARRSATSLRAALGQGVTSITLSNFAPGLNPAACRAPQQPCGNAIVDPAGVPSAAYAEARLLGRFLTHFGPRLARANPVRGLTSADDPDVQIATRLTADVGFIFLWDDQGRAAHHLRLTHTDPTTQAVITIPEAGSITLPPGGAKILVTGLPLDHGLLRYTTSEIAGLHQLGNRTLLILYGDPDTAGEIALQWPGPPLVVGDVLRQRWDSETSTLLLDYYHGQEDRYLLVDDLLIAILSRARAAQAVEIPGDSGAVTLSAGARVASASLDSSRLLAEVYCPAGLTRLTAALPAAPTSVTIDGQPAEFTLATPARVLTLDLSTTPFEQERRPTSVWNRLGSAVLGGPPKLSAEFDRAWFMPDQQAPQGAWRPVGSINRSPEALGLSTGGFARLRARFDPGASHLISLSGSTDPALVFVNDQFVPELSGAASQRRADVSALLVPGRNQIDIVLHILPRDYGLSGLRGLPKQLPEVALLTDDASRLLDEWEISGGLAGEAAGWQGPQLDLARWRLLRFGPWRAGGRDLAEADGVGWYRLPFGLPSPEAWNISYRMRVTLTGSAALYLNGAYLATCCGDGTYDLPLPAALVNGGEQNLLAAAVYGLSPNTGLEHIEVAADQDHMTRRRTVEVRF